MIGRTAAFVWLLATVSGPALAQEAAAPADAPAAMEELGEEEDIVVTGQRERGAVIGDIPPEVRLTPADIRSYGVNSVAELLEELAPQTRSGRGRGEGAPVTLLNGLRISGFAEIRDIPTEAIQRVDILPEEVALKYGFTADQKVVNIVLRRRFRATTVELDNRIATDGGAWQPEAELDWLRITPGGRLSLSAEYERTRDLLESQRGIAAGTGFDQRPFRTLLPAGEEASLNAVYATAIAEGVSAALNGRAQYDESRSLLGLAADGAGPLIVQRNDSLTTRAATTLNGAVSGWQWTFTSAYDRTETETRTSVAANDGRSVSSRFGGDFTVNGQPLQLPAGAVSATLRLNASASDFESRSNRNGVFRVGVRPRHRRRADQPGRADRQPRPRCPALPRQSVGQRQR
jgi:iron complex outermembrane recepter protein